MRRAPALFALAICLASGSSVLGGAGGAQAAEPFDGQLRELLVAPGDPSYAEITDAADPGRSGPLDAARLAAMGVTLPASLGGVMRGAALRGFADGGAHRVIELAYDLTTAANARRSLEALPSAGQAFPVQGIPGASGRAMPGSVPTAYAAFVIGTRSYLIVVGGTDPGHALVQDQALQVANAAAEGLAGDLTASVAAAGRPRAAEATVADPVGWRARASRAVRRNDVRLALAAVAALGLWVLLRSSRRRQVKPATSSPAMRNLSQSWQHAASWGAPGPWTAGTPAGGAADPQAAPAPWATARPVASTMALGGPVAGVEAQYFGRRDEGWGDELDPAAAWSAPAAASSAAPGPASSLRAVARLAAPAPPPNPRGPAAGGEGPPGTAVWTSPTSDEVYCFPGAPSWPEDGPSPVPPRR